MVNRKCWAASLGECSSKLSREHIVSAAFFDGNKITLSGFDWTRDKVVEIPLSSAVTKVLCEKHNNDLSDLDIASKEIGECFKSVITMASNAAGLIDGSKFERWLLKTTLNIICTSPQMYQQFWPDEFLAALVFGRIKFDYSTGMGLYAVHPNLYGNFTDAWNFVNVRPLILTIQGDTGLIGALITFWGIPFFLKTAAKTENCRLDVNGFDLIDEKFYHLKRIRSFAGAQWKELPGLTFSYES